MRTVVQALILANITLHCCMCRLFYGKTHGFSLDSTLQSGCSQRPYFSPKFLRFQHHLCSELFCTYTSSALEIRCAGFKTVVRITRADESVSNGSCISTPMTWGIVHVQFFRYSFAVTEYIQDVPKVPDTCENPTEI